MEDANIAAKMYCTILTQLLYDKKIPAITLLFVDGEFVSDFLQKLSFNNFFASVYGPIKMSLYPTTLLVQHRQNKKKFFSCYCEICISKNAISRFK